VRLTIVGCSGSFPGPDSAASCYLIEVEDRDRTWRIVLDLGSGALGPLQRLVELHQIDAILISHLHPDHFMDLCGLFVARRYHPAGTAAVPLLVYGPPQTADRVLQAYGPDAAGELSKVFDIRTLTDRGRVSVGPVTITTQLVEHPVVAYGMRIEHEGRVIAYSGDTDACESLLELACDADLLLAEASYQEGRDEVRGVHLTGRRAGETARDAGARRLVLTHLPSWTDGDVVVKEAKQVYLGPVEAAIAGVSYVLEDVRVR
jgi:ribonuclease BN (tRNA processing enzyme)